MIVLLLGTLAVPAEAAAASDGDFRVTKMIVDPNGPDMNFTVYYESGFFTRVFSILFGARVLQPDILNVFANFSNVSLMSIDSNAGVAKVAVDNVSKPGGDDGTSITGTRPSLRRSRSSRSAIRTARWSRCRTPISCPSSRARCR